MPPPLPLLNLIHWPACIDAQGGIMPTTEAERQDEGALQGFQSDAFTLFLPPPHKHSVDYRFTESEAATRERMRALAQQFATQASTQAQLAGSNGAGAPSGAAPQDSGSSSGGGGGMDAKPRFANGPFREFWLLLGRATRQASRNHAENIALLCQMAVIAGGLGLGAQSTAPVCPPKLPAALHGWCWCGTLHGGAQVSREGANPALCLMPSPLCAAAVFAWIYSNTSPSLPGGYQDEIRWVVGGGWVGGCVGGHVDVGCSRS